MQSAVILVLLIPRIFSHTLSLAYFGKHGMPSVSLTMWDHAKCNGSGAASERISLGLTNPVAHIQ